ncbi:Leucine rich repeat protein [Fasciolopsis buskii]|uniref:Leucine rich repeat protein n=1 Tax=Fasciolopsis buskii TaxID=27845 RepID=A0A8E0RT20_9TREM|nr:Leucine rich repeat protein [Fasciolopsis buski]
MPQVTNLILSRNMFAKFPEGDPSQLRNIKRLAMDYNCLESIPSATFSKVEQLTIVSLSNNNIHQMFDVAGYWIFVVELDLSYNVIDHLPESIGEMSSLEVLDLTSNRLKSLPRSIGKLGRLVRLHLEFNQITFLPLEIGELAELQLLNLESNQLSRLPSSIGKLSNLSQLKLTDNLLQRLPTEMGQLKRLTHLYLKNNSPLDQLPIELAILPELKILTLDGCNLRLIPAEVVNGGASSVIKYFRGLLQANVEMFKHFGPVHTEHEVAGEPPGQSTRKLSTSFSYALRHSNINST